MTKQRRYNLERLFIVFEIFIEVLNELGHKQKTGRQAPRHVTLVRSAANNSDTFTPPPTILCAFTLAPAQTPASTSITKPKVKYNKDKL